MSMLNLKFAFVGAEVGLGGRNRAFLSQSLVRRPKEQYSAN